MEKSATNEKKTFSLWSKHKRGNSINLEESKNSRKKFNIEENQ